MLVAKARSDGQWTGHNGDTWMYRAVPDAKALWRTLHERDRFVQLLDSAAEHADQHLLGSGGSREAHLLVIASDDPDATTAPVAACPRCGAFTEAQTTPVCAAEHDWPRDSVVALGLRLGAYTPPPHPETAFGRFYAKAGRPLDERSPLRSGVTVLARACKTVWDFANPGADPGTEAADAVMGRCGAERLDETRTDRLMGWQARSDDINTTFVASASGRLVECDAWGRDLRSGCCHDFSAGLSFCRLPIPPAAPPQPAGAAIVAAASTQLSLDGDTDAASVQILGGHDLADMFAQRPGLVAVSLRGWLTRSAGRAGWRRASALAAFRTIDVGHDPDLVTASPQAQHITPKVLLYRQIEALEEMSPLGLRRVNVGR